MEEGQGLTSGRLPRTQPNTQDTRPYWSKVLLNKNMALPAGNGQKDNCKRSVEAMRCAPYFVDTQTIHHNVGNPGSLAVQRPSLQPPFHCGFRGHLERTRKTQAGRTRGNHVRSCGRGPRRRWSRVAPERLDGRGSFLARRLDTYSQGGSR